MFCRCNVMWSLECDSGTWVQIMATSTSLMERWQPQTCPSWLMRASLSVCWSALLSLNAFHYLTNHETSSTTQFPVPTLSFPCCGFPPSAFFPVLLCTCVHDLSHLRVKFRLPTHKRDMHPTNAPTPQSGILLNFSKGTSAWITAPAVM